MSFAEFYTDALLEILGVAPNDPDLANKEAAAEKALAFSMSLVESYLDRGLEYVADVVEVFTPPVSRALVRRYPVEIVSEISWPPHGSMAGGTWPVESYRADLTRGIVYLGGYYGWPVGQVSIKYSGGFKDGEYPDALLQALFALAASVYPGIYENGLPVPTLAPNIKRLSMPDVGTVEFNGGGGDGGLAVMGYGEISAAHMGALDRYRAESIVGVG